MALVELNEGKLTYLFANHKFRRALASSGTSTPRHSEKELNSPSSSLGRNIHAFFLNILRTGQDQTITYPKKSRYMHLTGHHISTLTGKNRHLFQVHLSHISISQEAEEAHRLDDMLRNLYYLYQNITVLNLKDDTATPIIANTPFRQQLSKKQRALKPCAKRRNPRSIRTTASAIAASRNFITSTSFWRTIPMAPPPASSAPWTKTAPTAGTCTPLWLCPIPISRSFSTPANCPS